MNCKAYFSAMNGETEYMKLRMDTAFSMLLREYRFRNNITQGDLAARLLVSVNTIHLWETGRTKPSVGTLNKLSEIMDIPLPSLLEII